MRTPSCEKKAGLKKGSWSHEEDEMLKSYINRYGIWNWSHMPKFAGLSRSGKSCRLRWMNYLKPNVRRGNFSQEEDEIILQSHSLLGNRWSAIASKLQGRSDNEIKNYWHNRLKKRTTHNLVCETTKKNDMNESLICEAHEVEKEQDNHANDLFGTSFSLSSEDDSSSSSSSATLKDNNEVEKSQDNHGNDLFGSLFLQIFEDDTSSSSSSTTCNDHEVDFKSDYYDIGSPGTVKDLQSYWNQLCPLENMELGTSHQDISFDPIIRYSHDDATSSWDFFNNDYDAMKHLIE